MIRLIIHGGLGTRAGFENGKEREREALRRIAGTSFAFLASQPAIESVIHAVTQLEDEPIFNAGTGSKLQSDGIIRMTASVMDGFSERFAGVINIESVKNPVQVAAKLLIEEDRVLAGEQALNYARGQGFEPYNPETPAQRETYRLHIKEKSGTVGCVALDAQGKMAVATSTGGKGFEIPGRVSDSATVAGNFANAHAAVSCTGTGEHIVDTALAAPVVLRVTDGMPMAKACELSIAELKERQLHAALIALDKHGNMFQCGTSPYLT